MQFRSTFSTVNESSLKTDYRNFNMAVWRGWHGPRCEECYQVFVQFPPLRLFVAWCLFGPRWHMSYDAVAPPTLLIAKPRGVRVCVGNSTLGIQG